jgi:hypothetical protein
LLDMPSKEMERSCNGTVCEAPDMVGLIDYRWSMMGGRETGFTITALRVAMVLGTLGDGCSRRQPCDSSLRFGL